MGGVSPVRFLRTRSDSCWKKKIIPASNCQIDEIYNLSCLRDEGLDLPKSYIQYLVNMGEDDGGLLFDNLHCASTSLSMIIKNLDLLDA